MKRSLIWVVVALAGFASTLSSAPAGKYVITAMTITDLGHLGGVDSEARDINNSGTIVGRSETWAGVPHAFMWSPRSGMADIGTWFGSHGSEANGVNDEGAAVGRHWAPGLEGEGRAAYWGTFGITMSDVIDSDVAEDCQYGSVAFAINDAGTAAGRISLVKDLAPGDPAECVLSGNAAQWSSPWVPSLLPPWVLFSTAHDINDSGVIVGKDILVNNQAARWSGGVRKGVPAPPNDMPAMHYGFGIAYGVNNVGRVVGYFDQVTNPGTPQSISRKHAFLWDGSSSPSSDLGTLVTNGLSVAHEINEQGFVAGYANKVNKLVPDGFGYLRNNGFIWHPHFGMRALPRLAASALSDECEAYALNDRNSSNGVIQAVGYCAVNGVHHAVRWSVTTALQTPVCPTPTC